jgi:phosphoribosyl-ATP pyrophosphohydrolase/phosphoribosyl-AMP cyclohydrolase/histidinol dehydrogenase
MRIVSTILYKMETTIPLPLIPAVDLAVGLASGEGLARDQVGYLGCAYFTVGDETVDKILGFLQRHVSMKAYINATAVSDPEALVSLLDAGARILFLQESQLPAVKTYGDRIALAVSSTAATDIPAGGALVILGEGIEGAKAALKKLAVSKASPVFLVADSSNAETALTIAQGTSIIPIIPATKLTANNTSSDGKLSVPEIIASQWTSDRTDKLIPTVVTDEKGIALGLVYSSQESVAESLKTGTGTMEKILLNLESLLI